MAQRTLQRIVLFAGTGALCLAFIFLPWQRVVRMDEGYNTRDAGYHSLLNPPAVPPSMAASGYGRATSYEIDTSRLGVEVAGILLITGLLFLALRKSPRFLILAQNFRTARMKNCGKLPFR